MHELLYTYFKEKTAIDRETFDAFSHFSEPRNTRRNGILLSEGEICIFNLLVNQIFTESLPVLCFVQLEQAGVLIN
jgi:hypothetical protein